MEQDYYCYLHQDRKEHFTVPKGWTVSHFVEAKDVGPAPSVQEMTHEALSRPVGTLPFSDLASRAKRIAVLVDDATRPTPVAPILDVALSSIEKQGFAQDSVSIIVALGTHEPMEQKALEERLGSGVALRYKVIQHNARQSDLAPVHIPGDSRALKINPVAAEADLRVGISSILPHPEAGYGGGPKIVMPGVSNFEFIRDHHMKHVIHPGSTLGRTKGNPFHEDAMRAARAIGLDFSINCVYNQKGEIIRIVGGSLESAFGQAVATCLETLGHRFEEKVDVTISSAFPHTHGHQFLKGLSAPTAVTQDVGAILLIVPLLAPISREFLDSFRVVKERSHDNSESYVLDHLHRGMPYLPDKSMDFNIAASIPFRRRKVRTILVSPLIPKEEAETMGLEHASSLEEGIKVLESAYPRANVAIFPSGGLIIPLTAWES